ncbi:MAG: efflux RND transporter permease subunit [Myxococcales bacterium]|nr:efflux RND transporter permease subunit [Myxococcales bacterium]MCB9582571.1 efflux RND transporter permease subunit [Polyangiaceae bacterium]
MNKLLELSVRTRLFAFVVAAVLAVWGAYAYQHLTIEAFPDPTDTQVQVITQYSGQPTEEVERRVSTPIERELNGTPGLVRSRSISLFGLSLVTLTFGDGVDPLIARQQVTERLAGVDLPEGVHPELGPLATPIGEVYRYTLEGPNTDPMTLRTLQDWTVRPQFLQVQGVADVVSYGGLVREIHVTPEPAKLAALGVGLDNVFSALSKASANATGGYVQQGSEAFVIRSLGILGSADDIRRVRVGSHGGVPITIRDVAKVSEGWAPRQGVVTRGNDEDAVEGIVLMRRGENPSVVLDALRERIALVNQRMLPPGVKINAFYDRTDLVDTTLHTVFKNLTEGALLVCLVLFAFMLSVRASLIVAAAIPLSLAASFIYLSARGMSANLLSMGAVDFGIIVDGAVILVEHLFHQLAPHEAGHAPLDRAALAEKVIAASKEVARPTLFSLLIIIAAYLPIFSLQRVEGRIFAPLAHTVVSALLGALLVSFTLVPTLAYFALRKARVQKVSPLLTWAQRVFDPVLRWALRNTATVLIASFGLLIAALTLVPRMGSEFLPALNEGALYVTFTLPDNTSLDQGRALTPLLKRKLEKTPEVTELLTQLGRPEDGTDPTLPNNLEMFVKLRPMNQWRSSMKTIDDLTLEMAKNLSDVPGIDYNFSQPIRDNVAENISGQFGQIAVKIYGDDLTQLQHLADQTRAAISDVPGAADVGVVKASESPQIVVKLDRRALARYDLDMGDVQDYVETSLGGHVASELWEGQRRFDVTVRLPPANRSDLEAIRAIKLPLKDGSVVPLSAVAQVSLGTGRAAITRENGQRYVGVRMNVRGRDLGSFVAAAQQRVAGAVSLPSGYQMTWGGEFENQQRAMARLRLVIPIGIAITFLLLFSAFGSVFDSTVILLVVPLALLGGVLGLAAVGMPLSVSAAVGFIALLGQAVLNGVLIVSAIRARIEAGEPLLAAVENGTRERLRAVLMTALLASLGLLPAAMSHAIGSETQRPIAVVVVAGTVTAALVTLVVLPVVYAAACKLRAAFFAWRDAKDRAEATA